MRSDKIDSVIKLPCHLFVRAVKRDRKYLLTQIHNFFDKNEPCYVSERNSRGHYVYKLNKQKETAEVIPIEVFKFPNSIHHRKIRTIKLDSFLQNRMRLGITITTEKIFNHYRDEIRSYSL